jgi:large subunit ribosomal protein L4
MPSARYVALSGKAEDLDLAPEIFDVQVNVPVMHEVVRAQLAAARAGTHSTKTRGEVAGGGAKPWRQKGLGRARHGSIREPQWRGGGISHGPQPRDHSIRVNKKTRALALRSALTDRAREGKVLVVDFPEFEEPKTKRAVELLEDWGAEGRVLLVTGVEVDFEQPVVLSFRNLPDVEVVAYPTAYTVLAADVVVFSKSALDFLVGGGSRESVGAIPPKKEGGSGGVAAPDGTQSGAPEAAIPPKKEGDQS